MKQRFRLYRRNRGIYYIHDDETGKQESLHTRERAEASALFAAKTQSHRQAHLNLRLARTYLAATDPMVSERTWQVPMDELARTKRGPSGQAHRRRAAAAQESQTQKGCQKSASELARFRLINIRFLAPSAYVMAHSRFCGINDFYDMTRGADWAIVTLCNTPLSGKVPCRA